MFFSLRVSFCQGDGSVVLFEKSINLSHKKYGLDYCNSKTLSMAVLRSVKRFYFMSFFCGICDILLVEFC